MATNQKIQFKDPQEIITWLETALQAEQEKHKQFPILPDTMPGYEAAQAWGYVVAGYFLIEESFKALLYLRNIEAPRIHSLTKLFSRFPADDKDTLSEYYSDYRAAIGGVGSNFPFRTLDDFLENLDGDPNKKGSDYIGSFDWRYFLIEETRSQDMPFISIYYLHEVAYGCIGITKYIHRGNEGVNPRQDTYSWRMHWQRREKYGEWLTERLNSDDWRDLPDRWEILWGPDHIGRYDILRIKGGDALPGFSAIPRNSPLPVVDKRKQVAEFQARNDPSL